MAKGFPWYKNIESWIINELNARRGNQVGLSKLTPWLTATSNLGGQWTLGTETYTSVVGGKSFYDTKSSQKFRPNPIITDFSIDFAQRGTLRTGTMKIKCFTIDQLQLVQEYFLEPGISLFIQWGWNKSLSLGKHVVPVPANGDEVNLYYRNYDELNKKREEYAGCYDNLVGLITGGGSTISGDSYEVDVKFATNGELLYGVSKNTIICDKDKNKNEDDNVYTEEQINRIRKTNNSKRETFKLNWIYSYNSFPKEVRINNVQALGSDIGVFKNRSYVDFLSTRKDIIDDAAAEVGDTIINWNGANLNFFGKFIEAQDTESPVTKKQYMSFYAFIEIINASHTVVGENKKPITYVNINKSDKNGYIACFPDIFSPDERIFIPNKKSYNFLKTLKYYKDAVDSTFKATSGDNPTADFFDNSIEADPRGTAAGQTLNISFPILTETDINDGDKLKIGEHGWIGDIYVDIDIVNQALSNVNDPVKDILDSVLSAMSDAVEGFWQFQVLEQNDQLIIVDNNLRNEVNKKKDDIHTFNNIGINSDFLSSQFELTIEKAMMSKVIMEKSAPKDSKAGNSTDLTGIFSNKKDTQLILPKLSCNDQNEGDDKDAEQADKERKAAWKDIKQYCKLILKPNVLPTDFSANNIRRFILPGIFLNKTLFSERRKLVISDNTETAPAATGRPLPVKFSFTILGMSGFKVGHLYRVNGLPPDYNKRGAFQVEEIKHKIDGKHWTTDVAGSFRPFYKNKV